MTKEERRKLKKLEEERNDYIDGAFGLGFSDPDVSMIYFERAREKETEFKQLLEERRQHRKEIPKTNEH